MSVMKLWQKATEGAVDPLNFRLSNIIFVRKFSWKKHRQEGIFRPQNQKIWVD